MTGKTLAQMAVEVLTTADGRAKTALSHAHAATWRAARAAGDPLPIGRATPPDHPARRRRFWIRAMSRVASPAARRAASPCCMPWPISN